MIEIICAHQWKGSFRGYGSVVVYYSCRLCGIPMPEEHLLDHHDDLQLYPRRVIGVIDSDQLRDLIRSEIKGAKEEV